MVRLKDIGDSVSIIGLGHLGSALEDEVWELSIGKILAFSRDGDNP